MIFLNNSRSRRKALSGSLDARVDSDRGLRGALNLQSSRGSSSIYESSQWEQICGSLGSNDWNQSMVRCATQWQQPPWGEALVPWALRTGVAGVGCGHLELVVVGCRNMPKWRSEALCRSQKVGLKCFEELQLYWLAYFLKHALGALDSHAMWFAWAASSQFVPENPLESASRDQSWTVLVSPHVFSFPPGHGHTTKHLWNLRWDFRGVILCPSSMVVLERWIESFAMWSWWADEQIYEAMSRIMFLSMMAIHMAVCRLTNFVVSTISAKSISWILWASLEADWARWALSTSLSVSRDMMTQHWIWFPSSLRCLLMGSIWFNFPFARNTPFSGFSKGAMVEALALSQSELLQSGSLQHSAHTQYEVHLSHVARFGAESAKII